MNLAILLHPDGTLGQKAFVAYPACYQVPVAARCAWTPDGAPSALQVAIMDYLPQGQMVDGRPIYRTAAHEIAELSQTWLADTPLAEVAARQSMRKELDAVGGQILDAIQQPILMAEPPAMVLRWVVALPAPQISSLLD